MQFRPSAIIIISIICSCIAALPAHAQAVHGSNDTLTVGAVVYNGDTIEAKTLLQVDVLGYITAAQRARRAEWTRLRNAVYVTYPYARRAGAVLNDINRKLVGVANEADRKKYIQSREKDLRKEFTTPLTNLSVYQGKVLMKLINRETGNNCYEIIKEYKGGLVARVYQTVAFFFDSNLKQPYDATGDDAEMEKIVQEVQRMYGY
ncbi:MAG: DUF4294 domain-containing protein [Bacteroidetes bacterium]|nr:DUF4294 domain-containing protein [Bacteroidota bacterium]